MSSERTRFPVLADHRLIATVLAAALVGVIGSALAFEHIGGYIPCALCLEQRIPYYAAIPVAAVAMLSATLRWPAVVTRAMLLTVALLMVWSLYLAVYHAGVEWHWWAGPADCGVVAAPSSAGGAGILDALNTIIPPSCDQAALRVLGLSFAGWNAIASFALALVALAGARLRA